MQTANIMIFIGGGQSGNSVPKFGVTAAEIAVLRHIHGEDSVTDIEPAGDIQRSHREERARLVSTYGRQVDGSYQAPAVEALFPGAAARVFENLDELDVPAEFYKAETRATPQSAPKPNAVSVAENEIRKQPESDNDGKAPVAQPTVPTANSPPEHKGKGKDKGKKGPTSEAKPESQATGHKDGDRDAHDEHDGIGDMNDEHAKKNSMFD
jgi:hypothetical protein